MKKHNSTEAYYSRLKELANISGTKSRNNADKTFGLGTLIDYKRADNDISYGIVKENHHYYIKKSSSKNKPDVSDFTYINGLENITNYQYSSLAEADKQRNLMLGTINEAYSMKMNVNNGRKIMLNEDAEDNIEQAEDKLDDLEVATDLNIDDIEVPVDDVEVSIDDEDDITVGAEDGEIDVSIDDEGGESDEADNDKDVEDSNSKPTDDGADDDETIEIDRMIGKVTNSIRDTELTPSKVKSYVNSFLSAFKDKFPDVEIEDRKEMSNKIMKVVDDEEEENIDLKDDELSESEDFTPQGSYSIGNAGGYEIELSDDGESARVKDAFGSDIPRISDWLDITYEEDEDWDGENEDERFIPVIDKDGYNIPLNQVMRINENNEGGFIKYVESRGYDKDSIMECDDEEMTSLISGYATKCVDGDEDDDLESVSLFTNENIIKSLSEEYGHDEYAEKLDDVSSNLNESDGDKIERINELNWGSIKNAGKAVGGVLGGKAKGAAVKAGKAIGDTGKALGGKVKGVVDKAGKAIGSAISNKIDAIGSSFDNISNEISRNYNAREQNSYVEKIETMASKLGDLINKFNQAAVKAGGEAIDARRIATTISNQIKSGVNLDKYRNPTVSENDVATVETQPNLDVDFAPDADNLGVMSESERKIRNYVRLRLGEMTGKRKPMLSENKKSDKLKKLDRLIESQFNSFKKSDEKINEYMFNTKQSNLKKKVNSIKTNDTEAVDSLFNNIFKTSINQYGAIRKKLPTTDASTKYKALKDASLDPNGIGGLGLDKNSNIAYRSYKNSEFAYKPLEEKY